MGFTSEETGLIGDLLIVTELEDLRLEARPPGSKLETQYYLNPPPAIFGTWGFPARRVPLWGNEKQPMFTKKRPVCYPGQQRVSEASRTTAGPCARQRGSQASVAPLLLAPMGIDNRKKQTGTATQQLQPRRPAPLPPGLSPSASWRRRKGQAGPRPRLKTGL